MNKISLEQMVEYLRKNQLAIITEWRERNQTIEEAAAEYEMYNAIMEAMHELDAVYGSLKRNMIYRGYVQE